MFRPETKWTMISVFRT